MGEYEATATSELQSVATGVEWHTQKCRSIPVASDWTERTMVGMLDMLLEKENDGLYGTGILFELKRPRCDTNEGRWLPHHKTHETCFIYEMI